MIREVYKMLNLSISMITGDSLNFFIQGSREYFKYIVIVKFFSDLKLFQTLFSEIICSSCTKKTESNIYLVLE